MDFSQSFVKTSWLIKAILLSEVRQAELARDIELLLPDLLLLGIVEPLYPFAMLPQPVLLLLPGWVIVSTEAVLLAIVPPARVNAAIPPTVSSIAFLSVVL